jgi:E3 ubiquitin-protein ligase UBR4
LLDQPSLLTAAALTALLAVLPPSPLLLFAQVMARLAGWYSVHKLLLVVHSPRRSKAVASLRLWYCDSPVSDLQQLKQQGPPSLPAAAAAAAAASSSGSSSGSSRQPAWKLAAAEVPLSPGQTEVTVSFELPLLLSCLMVEFAGFHVSVNESSAEVLHCPRCSHVVTDKHGLCSYCR